MGDVKDTSEDLNIPEKLIHGRPMKKTESKNPSSTLGLVGFKGKNGLRLNTP